MTEFLSNIKLVLGISNHALATIAIVFAVVLIVVKVFGYIVNRVDTKDDKQFEALYKIIENNDFLERLSNQPFLIKQLFYRRFYLLKDYKLEEIEFLMYQSNLEISLYELSTLKSGHIIKFEAGRYIKNFNSLSTYWINNYWRFNVFIAIGFLLWILVMGSLFLFFIQSTTLFYISLTPLFTLEIYLLIKIDAVRAYLKTRDHIDDFLYQSETFKHNQGADNT